MLLFQCRFCIFDCLAVVGGSEVDNLAVQAALVAPKVKVLRHLAYALIALISGPVPKIFMTRVRL